MITSFLACLIQRTQKKFQNTHLPGAQLRYCNILDIGLLCPDFFKIQGKKCFEVIFKNKQIIQRAHLKGKRYFFHVTLSGLTYIVCPWISWHLFILPGQIFQYLAIPIRCPFPELQDIHENDAKEHQKLKQLANLFCIKYLTLMPRYS